MTRIANPRDARARFWDEDNDWTDHDIRPSETVCPECHLVYPTTAFQWGVCRDCFREGFAALHLR